MGEDRRYVAPQKDEDGPDPHARTYNLRQMLQAGMRALRDAEDHARTTMPAWPTADRIRFIHEQLTEDVLNGRTIQPSRGELEARLTRAEEALREIEERVAGTKGYEADSHFYVWIVEKARAGLGIESPEAASYFATERGATPAEGVQITKEDTRGGWDEQRRTGYTREQYEADRKARGATPEGD